MILLLIMFFFACITCAHAFRINVHRGFTLTLSSSQLRMSVPPQSNKDKDKIVDVVGVPTNDLPDSGSLSANTNANTNYWQGSSTGPAANTFTKKTTTVKTSTRGYQRGDMKNAIKTIVIGISRSISTIQEIVKERVKETDFSSVSDAVQKVKSVLQGKDGKGISLSKESLSALGLNALLAYGFVSNVSYITCLILSWISSSKMTGLSPLAPGQWKPFLAIYAGYFAANNLLRPLRFSLSLVITPFFNRIIEFIQKKTGYKKAVATGVVIFMVNIVGTISYMVLGISGASMITGVPIFPLK